ncbi:MAG: hypothetical protein DHS20C08_10300 [Rhodomicrobium sp.]|nr:MAG: hypothetical protein DHS20C08_10300 [Rhodomicrobium sp.]
MFKQASSSLLGATPQPLYQGVENSGLIDSPLLDSALPALARWGASGERGVLVTLVNVEGSAPRPIGAEMAVNAAGDIIGHIAVDCLGEAIRAEALNVLKDGKNRLIRFGEGSPYIDLKLPCGSGIDLYFDGSLKPTDLNSMATLLNKRSPFTLSRKLCTRNAAEPHTAHDHCAISPYRAERQTGQDEADETHFHRNYLPAPQFLIAGTGPAPIELAKLARQQGSTVTLLTPSNENYEALQSAGITTIPWQSAGTAIEAYVDPFTACALLFHDHDKELELLPALLKQAPFYIGAMGSRKTHQTRLQALKARGHDEECLSKIKGPAGLIPLAKNPALLALSIYSEILAEAQARNLIC